MLPQRCHGVAQLVYHTTDKQGGEEVSQLTGRQIHTRDLKTSNTRRWRKKYEDMETNIFSVIADCTNMKLLPLEFSARLMGTSPLQFDGGNLIQRDK